MAPTPSAIFTDTVYTHPTPVNNLTNNSYIQVKVDRDGHVIEASNPSSLNVSITGKAATAIPMVSSSVDGKMSKEDKQKLDGIAVGANKYVLPSKLPATIITEDSTHRWITDAEKSNYSDKYTKTQTDSKFLTKTEFVSKATATIGIGWTIDVDETQNMVFKYNGVIKGTLQTDGTFIVPTLYEITGDTGETESITLSELSSIVDLRTTTLTSIENPPAFVGQHAVVNKKIYFGISTAKSGSTESDVDARWTPIN